VNVGRSIAFLFDDPRGLQKFGWGVLATFGCLIGVGFLLLSGYQVRLARNVATGGGSELPEWDKLGELFADGARVVAVYAGLALPFIAAICCVGVGLATAADRVEGPEDPTALLFMLLIYCVPVPFAFALWALAPIIVAQVARTGSAVEAFRIGEWGRMVSAARGPAVIACGFSLALHIIGGLAGSVSCSLLLLAWTPLTYFAVGHLAGQLRARAEAPPA
jgi:hypothetical protein